MRRATGKAGVCMGTSGPGATNLVTAIADAYMDSCPLIAITGQVNQNMIGRGAFQETDIIGVTLPIVKHSYLITDVNDIPRIVKEAFYIAQTGRPGPVVIDFPKNIQQAKTQPVWPTLAQIKKGLRGYHQPDLRADDLALNEIMGLIEKAERPVIYCGGGIISSGAAAELKKFAEATNIPVTTTLMGIGGFPETHPLSLRWLGMHGAAFANWAVNGEYELRKSFQRPHGEDQGRRGFAARLRRAFRRPRDRQVRGILQERHDCPHGHRRLRVEQEPQGAPARGGRHQGRAHAAERDAGQAPAQQKAHGLARADRRVEEEGAVRLPHHAAKSPTATT